MVKFCLRPLEFLRPGPYGYTFTKGFNFTTYTNKVYIFKDKTKLLYSLSGTDPVHLYTGRVYREDCPSELGLGYTVKLNIFYCLPAFQCYPLQLIQLGQYSEL